MTSKHGQEVTRLGSTGNTVTFLVDKIWMVVINIHYRKPPAGKPLTWKVMVASPAHASLFPDNRLPGPMEGKGGLEKACAAIAIYQKKTMTPPTPPEPVPDTPMKRALCTIFPLHLQSITEVYEFEQTRKRYRHQSCYGFEPVTAYDAALVAIIRKGACCDPNVEAVVVTPPDAQVDPELVKLREVVEELREHIREIREEGRARMRAMEEQLAREVE